MMNAPDNDQNFELRSALIALAVEGWRLQSAVGELLDRQPEAKNAERQLRWFARKSEDILQGLGLRLVDLSGRPFDSGLPVSALNLDEFGPEARLRISRMIEPLVMGTEGPVRPGTVIVSEDL